MATGGVPEYIPMEEIPVIDRTVARDTPLPYDREFDDTGTQLLTDETSNLIDGETIVPFSGKGKSLGGATAGGAPHLKMIYITNPEDYTNVTDKEMNNALISSRTKWNFYLFVVGADRRTQGYILTYKEQGNNIVKFYSKKRFNDYGKDIAELIELLFTKPIEFNEKYNKMSEEQLGQMFGKHLSDSRRHEEWEHGPHDEPIRQPQATNTLSEFNKLIDKKLKPEQFFKEFIKLPQDELNIIGFNPMVVREVESLFANPIELANVKLELHNKIKELDRIVKENNERIKEKDEEIKELEDDNIDLSINLDVRRNEIIMLKEERDKLKTENGELMDQLIVEKKKVSDLDNERESQLSKFKRLLRTF